MGFFSWKTIDPGNEQSIFNNKSLHGPTPVVLLMPEEFGGENLIEVDYEGYGLFGCRDAYALIALWNRSEDCVGDDNEDRDVGIEVGCYDSQMALLEYPLRIVSLEYYMKTKCNYEDFDDDVYSKSCPLQGYFTEEEESEEQ